jgi:hypothetical protein
MAGTVSEGTLGAWVDSPTAARTNIPSKNRIVRHSCTLIIPNDNISSLCRSEF